MIATPSAFVAAAAAPCAWWHGIACQSSMAVSAVDRPGQVLVALTSQHTPPAPRSAVVTMQCCTRSTRWSAARPAARPARGSIAARPLPRPGPRAPRSPQRCARSPCACGARATAFPRTRSAFATAPWLLAWPSRRARPLPLPPLSPRALAPLLVPTQGIPCSRLHPAPRTLPRYPLRTLTRLNGNALRVAWCGGRSAHRRPVHAHQASGIRRRPDAGAAAARTTRHATASQDGTIRLHDHVAGCPNGMSLQNKRKQTDS